MEADKTRAELGSGQDQSDFLSLAETLSSLIVLKQDDKLIYVNPAGCALLGHPKEFLIGRHFSTIVHPDDRKAAIARAEEPLSATGPKRMTGRLIHANGETIWMEYSIDLMQFEGVATYLVTGYDITGRRRMEEELHRSEARLAEAQRIGHIGSWEWDIPRNRLDWSDELCRIYGVHPSKFGGTLDGYLGLVHPDDRSMARNVMEKALLEGGSFSFEHRVIHENGEIRTVFGRGEVFVDALGTPVRVAGTGQDITERRSMESALKESEERFRNLCTQAPVMLMAIDPEGRVRDVSNYWLQTMGYTREEIVGREAMPLLTPDSQERLEKAIEENERNHKVVIKNLPIRAIRRDGTTIDLLSTSVGEISDSGDCRGAICVDINLTDLQRAEAALRESEERYRALVEHAPEAIMVLDVEKDHFVDVNAHAEKLFGYSRERLLTMGPLDFCSEQQADGRHSSDVIADKHRKVLDGETPVFEFTHIDAAGRKIECQTRLSRLPAEGRKLIRISTTDISELKKLQEKVRHTEKLAAVGVLAAGVAHEIGNPLMALSQAAQSLQRRSCDEYAKMKLTLIGEHIDRISRIVRQMSNLARPQNAKRTTCDINQLVRRSVDMVRHDRRSRNAEIRYELEENLPVVEGVEDELTQVCINLALNAFDAMAANPQDRPRCLTIRSGVVGSSVRVSFSDSGPGVPEQVRSKLFQPFVTTKEAGRGTGLGLSVSYRILQEHQGNLRLEEDGAPGALFVMELPIRSKP